MLRRTPPVGSARALRAKAQARASRAGSRLPALDDQAEAYCGANLRQLRRIKRTIVTDDGLRFPKSIRRRETQGA
jgi:hypothetical protein